MSSIRQLRRSFGERQIGGTASSTQQGQQHEQSECATHHAHYRS
jgi:hypothetical protein